MSENPFKQTESYKSLEILKEESSRRLNSILYKSLTVENIEFFAEEALTDTIELINELLSEYQTNPNLEGNLSLNTQEQEDDVCRKLELQNISDILDRIQEVKSKINTIKTFIHESKEESETVITPPDQLLHEGITAGDHKYEKKKLIPRLLTLMYILETDFDIDIKDTEQVHVLEGQVTNEMMRQTPYVRVMIPEIKRVVYVCDEEENVTYVFDTEKLDELDISLDDLDIDGKQNKNTLITTHSGVGVRIIQTPNWRNRMKEYLEKITPSNSGDLIEKNLNIKSEEGISEFIDRRKKRFITYNEFESTVRQLYSGDESIREWYRRERKSHPEWPGNPEDTYKNKGWLGWPHLFGRDSKFKEWSSFDELKKEVKSVYDGEANIAKWYEDERSKHAKWPASPDRTYKDIGWSSWPDLVGVEKEFLNYQDFEREIRSLYSGKIGIQRWFHLERKNHPNWPSNPDKHYKDDWKGFGALGNLEKKEFLSFSDFVDQVNNAYPGSPGVSIWYREESKKHPEWPSLPEKFYKDRGWSSWTDLIK